MRPTLIAVLCLSLFAATTLAAESPRTEEFESNGAKVAARVLMPTGEPAGGRPALVLFHGGGWSEGEASWMDGIAAQYTELGFVTVSVEYRLSRGASTPFDAVADARNAIRWVRREASRLGVNPQKVAALGTSAGAHLAAAAAVFDEPSGDSHSSVPDALVLRSPAVSVERSTWFRKLAGGASQAAALSPVLHVRAGLPPMLLLQGAEDNVTPASDAQRFCQRMQEKGNVCRLAVYPGVGHLFTRNLSNQEVPDYDAIDKDISREAGKVAVAFLSELGFVGPTRAR